MDVKSSPLRIARFEFKQTSWSRHLCLAVHLNLSSLITPKDLNSLQTSTSEPSKKFCFQKEQKNCCGKATLIGRFFTLARADFGNGVRPRHFDQSISSGRPLSNLIADAGTLIDTPKSSFPEPRPGGG